MTREAYRMKTYKRLRQIDGVTVRLRGEWGWYPTSYLRADYERSEVKGSRNLRQWLQLKGRLDSAVNGLRPK